MSEELLLLSSIREEFFGLTERVAMRKAADGLLPIPAFRLSGTRKGPLYVRKADLDAHIQKQIDKAVQLNSRMKSAGLV